MSKPKLKSEDIFFSLQKAHESRTKSRPKPEDVFFSPLKVHESSVKSIEAGGQRAAEREEAREAAERMKRGPAANPDNSHKVSMKVFVPPEVKYGALLVVNEMRLRGVKERYSLTDFVIEAVEEKISRAKKQLDME